MQQVHGNWEDANGRSLSSIGMTVLGIVLSLVPPALWIAWTETGLLAVVAVGFVSAGLLIALADSRTDSPVDRQTSPGAAATSVPSVACVVEVHRIFPLTYHHSLIEKARFRRTMEKVQQLLK
jgi:hypothetical protein